MIYGQSDSRSEIKNAAYTCIEINIQRRRATIQQRRQQLFLADVLPFLTVLSPDDIKAGSSQILFVMRFVP